MSKTLGGCNTDSFCWRWLYALLSAPLLPIPITLAHDHTSKQSFFQAKPSRRQEKRKEEGSETGLEEFGQSTNDLTTIRSVATPPSHPTLPHYVLPYTYAPPPLPPRRDGEYVAGPRAHTCPARLWPALCLRPASRSTPPPPHPRRRPHPRHRPTFPPPGLPFPSSLPTARTALNAATPLIAAVPTHAAVPISAAFIHSPHPAGAAARRDSVAHSNCSRLFDVCFQNAVFLPRSYI
ncbi:hypothetical protein MVEN_02555900 [Mycena venus]|uniref:Uncharacterized protein n=1 Tax=Mycena venus TaxID=2733690 RepID=A0A8H6U3Z9_9AGAR|nr:hypothetical protein MVEN_02555900 [Mycena venus]